MRKKIFHLIPASIIAFILAIGLFICFITGWVWAWQMLVGAIAIIVIVALKSRSNNTSTNTYLAEYATLLGVSFAPTFMDSIPQIVELHEYLVSLSPIIQNNISLNAVKNSLYFVSICIIWIIITLTKRTFRRDKTAMQKKLPSDFFDAEFLQRREHFCDMLKIELNAIDKGAQWNDYYFTPLEAEFIVEDNHKVRRKSRDIISAIRERSKERAFLILGNPGSGKSTVLRKLAKDLLFEVEKTNRIPVYINLKDWNAQRQWTPQDLPNEKDFFEFIKNNLDAQLGDLFAHNFLKNYLEKLCLNGHLFFIFDSFDEIPFLLDEPENSWLVDAVSGLLFRVLAGQSGSRGVLASRFFRKPTDVFQSKITLEIKPFNDTRIQNCLSRYANGETLSKLIYKEHREWLKIISNPFYANLLSVYFDETNELPQREIELYDYFFKSRINLVEDAFQLLSENNVTVDDVLISAQIIAEKIFNERNYGIGIPTKDVLSSLNISQHVIDILLRAKLIRVGGSTKKIISFSHRRFNEYLVAIKLLNREIKDYLNTIPEDSKWHDTLVLYAQLCPHDKSKTLIEYCCKHFDEVIVEKNEDENHEQSEIKFKQALHSLRFLTAAFSHNKERLLEYEKSFYDFIVFMQSKTYILYHKFAVSAITILSETNIGKVLDKALKEDIAWIRDDAIEGCFYLSELSKFIKYQLYIHYLQEDIFSFVIKFKNNWFALSLFDKYKTIRYYLFLQMIEHLIKIVAICFVSVVTFIEHGAVALFIPLLFALSNVTVYLFNQMIKSDKGILGFNFFPSSRRTGYLYNSVLFIHIQLMPIMLLIFSMLFIGSDDSYIPNSFTLLYLFFPYVFTLAFLRNINFMRIITMIRNIKEHIGLIAIALTVLICFGGVIAGIAWLVITFSIVRIVLLSVLFFIFLIYGILLGLRFIKSYMYFRTLNIKKQSQIERSSILSIFENIKSTSLQRKILSEIENKKIELTGEWCLDPPSLNNKQLNVRLAIIDGKSLNLL